MNRSPLLCAMMLVTIVAALHTVYAQAETSAEVSDGAARVTYFNPGDAVRVSSYPDTTLFLNGIYRIDESGYIHLPLAGRLFVANKSTDDLASFINMTYVQHLSYPNVQIEPLIRISFLGGFQNPGLYYVDPKVSLWDAVQISGGPVREDGFKKMKWERGRKVLTYDMVPLLESGNSLHQLGFKSGDQVLVTARPQMSFWETVRTDVVPIATFAATTLLTVLTIYRIGSSD